MFVGKKQFLRESPRSHVKHANKWKRLTLFCSGACDVIWLNGKLCWISGGFTTGVVDLAPHRWPDGDHVGGSMEIKHVDEKTISYHTYLHLMLLCKFLLVLILDTRR
jgi:hypothetical protein